VEVYEVTIHPAHFPSEERRGGTELGPASVAQLLLATDKGQAVVFAASTLTCSWQATDQAVAVILTTYIISADRHSCIMSGALLKGFKSKLSLPAPAKIVQHLDNTVEA